MLALPSVARDSELDGGAVGGPIVELGDLVVGSGEADLQAFNLPEAALSFGLGDAGVQVVAGSSAAARRPGRPGRCAQGRRTAVS